MERDIIKRIEDLMDLFDEDERDPFVDGGRIGFGEGTKTKLVEFVEKFKSQNKKPPTIMEVADGAKSSTASIRKYLEEGVDFVKTDLSEVGKKGGDTSGAKKKTGVTKLDNKAYKELQDLRIKGVSFQVGTGVGGSTNVRVTIQDPNVSKAFFGDKKTSSFTADAKGIDQAKNLIKQVAISEVYKDNVLPFQTDEYKLKIKRLKAKQYKLRDPFGVYKALQEYKTEVFPGKLSKEIQIQHGDAKFTTQTLSRMGLIDAAANISPAVEKVERLRNNALKLAMSTLDNPNASVAAKKAAAEKYNSIAKGLRGQLKGTEGQGLVNFQLLDVDDKGNYKKLKDISFDPKKGLVDSDLDLSKITKEQADELIAKGKKKLDVESVKLKTGSAENFLKNLENKKFRRVTDVVVKASQDGGFGEVVQKICKRRTSKKGGRIFFAEGPGCPAARDDPKGFLRSISDNPQLAKFLKSGPGKKAMTMAARVSGNVLNPTTLIGGEVAFVLGDGLNNFASGLPLDESFDRAFVFGDFGKFEKNLMNKAKELGYDDNQLNLLQQTININKLDNRKRKLEYGLDVEEQDMSGLTSDATMGFENRLDDTNKQLGDSVNNYLDTLDKMGFDIGKASDQETGFTYLDNVFKKNVQDQLVKDFEDRKRQVDPTQTPVGDFLSPFIDLGTYTQPLKFAADIFNPFTKDVPFLSERQQLAKKLREASEEQLDEINRKRGFTIEDIQQGTAPQIREVMEQLGTDVTGQGFGTTYLAGGGIAKLAGVDQGPPPESGPNSQGLPSLLKRVRNL